ncbi:SRPBCC domain-containing protein [Oceanomicrobium pacificus]|uniref:Activator of Hsp90 ATPase homologue 1/2-like C-terminal domain-containing protein n=1 Tax=Oceanomicrobium pacificus TaxID=2692916 RepID=A0A6B0TQ42_9RHOB|nr:SRPBCC domain-containing protein [Oceanomicrobium pacificus]MXU64799.1 hypothetical protein [Oceanomicrobium pacificus]
MPAPAHATVTVARNFDHPVDRLFAHWTSPATRARWEAGPDTGMRYAGFDTRPGGVETVHITHEGKGVGHMVQRIHVVDPPRLLAVSVEGHFGGAVTMMMQLTVRFSAHKGGSRLEAVTQATDLGGRDPGEQQEQGWAWLLDRFEADIAEHGLAPANPEDRT